MPHPLRKPLNRLTLSTALAGLPAAMLLTAPIHAAEQRIHYAIAAGPLNSTLLAISRQSGQLIAFDQQAMQGSYSPAINGDMSFEQALAKALANSNLRVQRDGAGAISIQLTAGSRPAQPSAPQAIRTPEAPRLENVVVTAERREDSAQKVPVPISVISGRTLENTHAGNSATQVTRFIPNTSSATIDNQRPRWWILGIGTGDQRANTVSPVGIYLDDVYLNNVDATSFPPFDLARVEVLKGPQGTLWGKNTTAGAINFISRKPDFKDNPGYLTLDGGSQNNRTVEGAGGAVLVSDKIAARVSFRHNERDGLADDKTLGGRSGDTEDDALRLQLAVNFSDTLDGVFNLHYRKFHSNGNGLDGSTGGVFARSTNGTNAYGFTPRLSRTHVNYNVSGRDDLEHKGASATFNWKLDDLTLTSISAFEDVTRTIRGDSDYTPLDLSRGYRDLHSRQWSQELRIASPKERTLSWVAGAHYFHEKLDYNESRASVDNTSLTPYFNSTETDQGNTSFAIFGSTTWQVSEPLSLTTGLRWTHEQKDIDLDRVAATGAAAFSNPDRWWSRSSISGPLAVTAVQDESKTWNDFTWDVTPEYQINDHARVYFRYARGFRSGGFNTGATTQGSVATVSPEYLSAYELGFKSEWLDNRLNVNGSVFYYDYKDIQLNAVIGTSTGSLSTLTNGASGKVRGAELEVEAAPLEGPASASRGRPAPHGIHRL
ncbi:TonB-dependent receptor domain-containing protein [Pseudomonas carnis]|uniref:TonB-dependent receptor domain-containing protein n=1 Tax=Pseudomonas carnis TaxID=2487355 RepID=UPI001D8E8CE2|nr:TonB-dependent receptor [Pseudomonas carnis]CAH0270349.1 Ferripyoverdine receptor [Pseudomonas carnis]CAH0284754.1 Ferripyoverdine receptor [Pseudomonas carnis]CAH0304276.1 Ferripyoverdine receptor [Pseudomonas carnis]CAH0308926.1 Ferripyoverdine receptor [Pseudomonas carnis]